MLKQVKIKFGNRKSGHHQDGNIGNSHLQFPSQEDQPTAIHRQNTIVKISKHKGEADRTPIS